MDSNLKQALQRIEALEAQKQAQADALRQQGETVEKLRRDLGVAVGRLRIHQVDPTFSE